jgi:hypothetical protein
VSVRVDGRARYGSRVLPPSPIRYSAEPLCHRVRRGERIDHRYDEAAFRIFEAAQFSAAAPDAVWRTVQRFPQIWSRLSTTTGEHRIVKRDDGARSIDVGNLIRADAVVFGIRVAMENAVTAMVEGSMFNLSVRALRGVFESEVEARIEPFDTGTLLIWRQGYPDARFLSRVTSRLLAFREAEETKRILDSWAAEQAQTPHRS